jgi:hypothetical protein
MSYSCIKEVPDWMKANSFQERVAVTEGRELMPRIITRANPKTPEIHN